MIHYSNIFFESVEFDQRQQNCEVKNISEFQRRFGGAGNMYFEILYTFPILRSGTDIFFLSIFW